MICCCNARRVSGERFCSSTIHDCSSVYMAKLEPCFASLCRAFSCQKQNVSVWKAGEWTAQMSSMSQPRHLAHLIKLRLLQQQSPGTCLRDSCLRSASETHATLAKNHLPPPFSVSHIPHRQLWYIHTCIALPFNAGQDHLQCQSIA